MNKTERKNKLRERVKQNIKDREKGARLGSSVLNTSQFSELPWFQPKAKKVYHVDVLPYEIKTKNHPSGDPPGSVDYVLDIWVHYRVGAKEDDFLCLKYTFGKPCPICEATEEARRAGDIDDTEVRAMAPKRRCFYNIIDVNDPDKGIQLFAVSYHLFEREMLEEMESQREAEEDEVNFADLEEGKTIKFRTAEDSIGKGKRKFVRFKNFSFEDRESPYEDDIWDEVYPLDEMLVVPNYETVQNAFLGTDSQDKEEEGGSTPPPRSHTKESLKDDSEEEEEEEQPQTLRRGGKMKNLCPYGHTYGKDCDDTTDCSSCEKWEDCANVVDSMKSESTDDKDNDSSKNKHTKTTVGRSRRK